jgi:L-2-hydroxyglutarate oxidase LhgO
LKKEIAIIGGGILGLAIGYELSISHPNFKVTLFEKEDGLGKHQSGNNSGVLHCGLLIQSTKVILNILIMPKQMGTI